MNDSSRRTARWALWLPLVIFAGFVVLAVVGMVRPGSRDVASAMIGKPLPQFSLRPATDDRPGLATSDFAGKPRLLNIFASWCVPCAIEAPQLEKLRAAGVEIHGVAIRDRKEDVAAFLARNGNPFTRIGADDISAVQMGIGSSGVPETFVIDAQGIIRYQHIGEIRPDQVDLILAKVKEAGQ